MEASPLTRISGEARRGGMALSAPQSPRLVGIASSDSLRVTKPYLHVPCHIMDRDRSRSLPPRQPSPSPSKATIRRKLPQYNTLEDAVELLKACQNIVVLSGAGISTSLGIPDFRSKNGLYEILRRHSRYTDDPQQLFELDNFKEHPSEFYDAVERIIPKLRLSRGTDAQGVTVADKHMKLDLVPRFTRTHAFLSLLQSKNKLLTNYTQNIDGLELAAGVNPDSMVNCHGNWESATCLTCGKRVPAKKFLPILDRKRLPICRCTIKPVRNRITPAGRFGKPSAFVKSDDVDCKTSTPLSESRRSTRPRPEKKKTQEREVELVSSDEDGVGYNIEMDTSPSSRRVKKHGIALAKKRKVAQYEDESDEDTCNGPEFLPGLLKPDITFFGEEVSEEYAPRMKLDKAKVDLLLIIGTSLKVEPVNKFPFQMPDHVPQIWISKERCQRGGLKVDIELIGECDFVVHELCRLAGWTNGLKNRLWRENLRDFQERHKDKLTKAAMNESGSQGKGGSVQPATTLASINGEAKLLTLNPRVVEDKYLADKDKTRTIATETQEYQSSPSSSQITPRTNQSAISPARPATSTPTKSKAPLPASLVVMELEEGTENRWLIRRA